jgi:hypothetical protein
MKCRNDGCNRSHIGAETGLCHICMKQAVGVPR